jgi:hypothetical protein
MDKKGTVKFSNLTHTMKATQELLRHYKVVKAASAAETLYYLHTSALRLWLQATQDLDAQTASHI